MKRTILIGLVLGVLAFVLLCFSYLERTVEFDYLNFRQRSCERTRSRFFDWTQSEDCSRPRDHPVAKRLRELEVLGPIKENGLWALVAGWKPGVRGWRGGGRDCMRALGAVSFGTPVTMTVDEDLDQNLWVKWAGHDPNGAKLFWQQMQSMAQEDGEVAILYLADAKEYLEQRKGIVLFETMKSDLRRLGARYNSWLRWK